MALHETDVLRIGVRFSRVALCFGSIDGIRRRVDDRCYTIRFTPRQPRSVWSIVNTAHVARLMKRGLMTPAGIKAFRERDPKKSRLYSYEARIRPLGGEYVKRFKAHANRSGGVGSAVKPGDLVSYCHDNYH